MPASSLALTSLTVPSHEDEQKTCLLMLDQSTENISRVFLPHLHWKVLLEAQGERVDNAAAVLSKTHVEGDVPQSQRAITRCR